MSANIEISHDIVELVPPLPPLDIAEPTPVEPAYIPSFGLLPTSVYHDTRDKHLVVHRGRQTTATAYAGHDGLVLTTDVRYHNEAVPAFEGGSVFRGEGTANSVAAKHSVSGAKSFGARLVANPNPWVSTRYVNAAALANDLRQGVHVYNLAAHLSLFKFDFLSGVYGADARTRHIAPGHVLVNLGLDASAARHLPGEGFTDLLHAPGHAALGLAELNQSDVTAIYLGRVPRSLGASLLSAFSRGGHPIRGYNRTFISMLHPVERLVMAHPDGAAPTLAGVPYASFAEAIAQAEAILMLENNLPPAVYDAITNTAIGNLPVVDTNALAVQPMAVTPQSNLVTGYPAGARASAVYAPNGVRLVAGGLPEGVSSLDAFSVEAIYGSSTSTLAAALPDNIPVFGPERAAAFPSFEWAYALHNSSVAVGQPAGQFFGFSGTHTSAVANPAQQALQLGGIAGTPSGATLLAMMQPYERGSVFTIFTLVPHQVVQAWAAIPQGLVAFQAANPVHQNVLDAFPDVVGQAGAVHHDIYLGLPQHDLAGCTYVVLSSETFNAAARNLLPAVDRFDYQEQSLSAEAYPMARNFLASRHSVFDRGADFCTLTLQSHPALAALIASPGADDLCTPFQIPTNNAGVALQPTHAVGILWARARNVASLLRCIGYHARMADALAEAAHTHLAANGINNVRYSIPQEYTTPLAGYHCTIDVNAVRGLGLLAFLEVDESEGTITALPVDALEPSPFAVAEGILAQRARTEATCSQIKSTLAATRADPNYLSMMGVPVDDLRRLGLTGVSQRTTLEQDYLAYCVLLSVRHPGHPFARGLALGVRPLWATRVHPRPLFRRANLATIVTYLYGFVPAFLPTFMIGVYAGNIPNNMRLSSVDLEPLVHKGDWVPTILGVAHPDNTAVVAPSFSTGAQEFTLRLVRSINTPERHPSLNAFYYPAIGPHSQYRLPDILMGAPILARGVPLLDCMNLGFPIAPLWGHVHNTLAGNYVDVTGGAPPAGAFTTASVIGAGLHKEDCFLPNRVSFEFLRGSVVALAYKTESALRFPLNMRARYRSRAPDVHVTTRYNVRTQTNFGRILNLRNPLNPDTTITQSVIDEAVSANGGHAPNRMIAVATAVVNEHRMRTQLDPLHANRVGTSPADSARNDALDAAQLNTSTISPGLASALEYARGLSAADRAAFISSLDESQ